MQHHKYSLTELNDDVTVGEIYVNLLINYIKEEKEKQKRTNEMINFIKRI